MDSTVILVNIVYVHFLEYFQNVYKISAQFTVQIYIFVKFN